MCSVRAPSTRPALRALAGVLLAAAVAGCGSSSATQTIPAVTEGGSSSPAQTPSGPGGDVSIAFRRLLASSFRSQFATSTGVRAAGGDPALSAGLSSTRTVRTRTAWESPRRVRIVVSDPARPLVREIVIYDGSTYVSADGVHLYRLNAPVSARLVGIRANAVPGLANPGDLQGARLALHAGAELRYDALLNPQALVRAVQDDLIGSSSASQGGTLSVVHNRFALAVAGDSGLPLRQAMHAVVAYTLAPRAGTIGGPRRVLVSFRSAGRYHFGGTPVHVARPRAVGTVRSLSELARRAAGPQPAPPVAQPATPRPRRTRPAPRTPATPPSQAPCLTQLCA